MKILRKQSKKIGMLVLLCSLMPVSAVVAATVASERIRLEAALQRDPLRAKAEIAGFMSALKAADAAYKEAIAAGISKSDQQSLQGQGRGAAGPTLNVKQAKKRRKDFKGQRGGTSSSLSSSDLLEIFKSPLKSIKSVIVDDFDGDGSDATTYKDDSGSPSLDVGYNDLSIEELYTQGANVLNNVNSLAAQYEIEAEILNLEADILEAANSGRDTQRVEAELEKYEDKLLSSIVWHPSDDNRYDAIYTVDGSVNGLNIGICADRVYHAQPMSIENTKKPWYIPIYSIQEDAADVGLGSILIASNSPKLQTCSCISQYTTKSGTSCTVCTGVDGLAEIAYVGKGPATDCFSDQLESNANIFSQKSAITQQRQSKSPQIFAQGVREQKKTYSEISSFIDSSSVRVGGLDSEFDTALDTPYGGQYGSKTTIFGSIRSFIYSLYTNTVDVFSD